MQLDVSCEELLRGLPPKFAPRRVGEMTCTPVEILGNIGDLLE